MRKTILSIVPEAEEVVSYGMPAFKVDGNIMLEYCMQKTMSVITHLVGQ